MKGRGHFVVEEIEDNYFSFVTNQHLILLDYYWVSFLFITMALSKIISDKILFFINLSNNSNHLTIIACIGQILFIILYFFYISPLFGMNPTPFKILDPKFKDCWIKEEPEFGIEFSLRGLFHLEHFTLKNDWIRISCPHRFDPISDFVPGNFIKTKTNNTPKSLGILHKAGKSWWDTRMYDYSLIKRYDEEKLRAHIKVFKENEKTCVNEYCWWGNLNSVVKETDSYFVLNSTLLPGHSGISCRESHEEQNFHGIVQGFHHGHGYNICSKLSRGEWSLKWLLFPFYPLIIILLLYFYISSKWIFKNLSCILVIISTLIGLNNENTYYI
jgi:hypothetical protein